MWIHLLNAVLEFPTNALYKYIYIYLYFNTYYPTLFHSPSLSPLSITLSLHLFHQQGSPIKNSDTFSGDNKSSDNNSG